MCKTHGLSGHPLWNRWRRMIQRCHGTDKTASPNYKGRGVTVCQRWRDSFEAFVADMGLPPTPQHQLDRFPNPDGNYEPGNVRWATPAQQSRNRRRNRKLPDGRMLIDVARENGISDNALDGRLARGWPPEAAVAISPKIGPPLGFGPEWKHFEVVPYHAPTPSLTPSEEQNPTNSATTLST